MIKDVILIDLMDYKVRDQNFLLVKNEIDEGEVTKPINRFDSTIIKVVAQLKVLLNENVLAVLVVFWECNLLPS